MRCGVGPQARRQRSACQARRSTIWPGRWLLALSGAAVFSSLISRTTLPESASVKRNVSPPWAPPDSNSMVTEPMGTDASGCRGAGAASACGAVPGGTMAAPARGAASPHPAGAGFVGGSCMDMVEGFEGLPCVIGTEIQIQSAKAKKHPVFAIKLLFCHDLPSQDQENDKISRNEGFTPALSARPADGDHS